MNKKVVMNSPMRKHLESKFSNICILPSKRYIGEIDLFFKKVKMYERDGVKCFSPKNIFESYLHFDNNNSPITEWEWDTNEIYLDKSLIKRQYKKTIVRSSQHIEKILLERFPNNSFQISFCIQFGKYRNISIRICQDLDDSILERDLNKYDQPIMQVYLKT